MNPCDDGRAHHFVLETPHDGQRMVNGVCRLCGVAKQFPAGYEEDPMRRSKPPDSRPTDPARKNTRIL